MKSIALSLLILSLELFCLTGCQQEPVKEGAAKTKPTASLTGKKAGETPAPALKTEEKKAEEKKPDEPKADEKKADEKKAAEPEAKAPAAAEKVEEKKNP